MPAHLYVVTYFVSSRRGPKQTTETVQAPDLYSAKKYVNSVIKKRGYAGATINEVRYRKRNPRKRRLRR